MAALALAAATAALALAGPHPVTAATASVQVVQAPSAQCAAQAAVTYCFFPASVTVAPGDAVTWTNTTNTKHTVTECTPSSSATTCPNGAGTGSDHFGHDLGPGNGSYSTQLSNPGTYYYYCSIHTYMHGMVTVSAPSPTGTPIPLTPAPGTTPPTTPTPLATPSPTPSPTATPSPSPPPSDTTSSSPTTSSTPDAGTTAPADTGSGGGGSPLVVIVLLVIVVLAAGGAVFAYRMYRSAR